jgi:phosphate transport system protein
LSVEQEPVEGPEPLRELRRGYHDRIAEVRAYSLDILRAAISGTDAASEALLDGRPCPSAGGAQRPEEMVERAALVDSEVIGLLALEAPVARDLRLVLVSRDVTQLGLLCIGLCAALADRAERVSDTLTDDLRRRVGEVSAGTRDLLQAAEAAWATLDVDLAAEVEPQAVAVRERQTEFISALIALEGVPMEAALNLAVVARAFERLADHALEIAERVRFAVQGTPPQVSLP